MRCRNTLIDDIPSIPLELTPAPGAAGGVQEGCRSADAGTASAVAGPAVKETAALRALPAEVGEERRGGNGMAWGRRRGGGAAAQHGGEGVVRWLARRGTA